MNSQRLQQQTLVLSFPFRSSSACSEANLRCRHRLRPPLVLARTCLPAWCSPLPLDPDFLSLKAVSLSVPLTDVNSRQREMPSVPTRLRVSLLVPKPTCCPHVSSRTLRHSPDSPKPKKGHLCPFTAHTQNMFNIQHPTNLNPSLHTESAGW